MGDRQMLPMQTNNTRYDRGGPAWRDLEFAMEAISPSSAVGSGYGSPFDFSYDSAPMRFVRQLCRLAVAAHLATSIAAEAAETNFLGPGDVIMVQAAPAAIHFDPDPAHVDYSWLVGIEWERSSHWLVGFSYFNNSFGQKCQYYYGGYSWRFSEGNPNWYLKLTGGLLVGYKEPHEDAVPYNHNGYSPGLIPAVGYKWNRFNVQLNILGTAGLMVTVGYDLFR